jgi:hypothetical protein
MAYTIIKSDGTVLTTIADGTLNTTSTSLGLAGRNYAGWGQPYDTNFVHLIENFADTTPPPNPLRGQLWFNTTNSTLYVCPTDGQTNVSLWLTLAATSGGGSTNFGAINVTGNVDANNVNVTYTLDSNSVVTNYLTVSTNATILTANVTTANLTTTRTTAITTGAAANTGTLTGTWTINGTDGGNAVIVTGGDLAIPGLNGIRTDKYMYANGNVINFGGSYSNANVQSYLPTYTGIVGDVTGGANATFRGNLLSTGSSANAGSITGNWTLTSGSKLQATYADLAERFEADEILEPGTVVELGGAKEITKVKDDLSEKVFGVVSNTAAYLMNSQAGSDDTHPAIALAGRVTVKVVGTVTKGQRLVSAGNGMARAANENEATAFNTIGRALEDKLTSDTGTVKAVVMIR